MSNSAYAQFKLEGLEEILRVVRELPDETQKKVLAVAVRKAAAPLVSAAKMFAGRSVRTGALRESITAIVKKGKGGGVYAVVGPARGYFRRGVALKAGDDAKGADMPANYAHLVEFGHVAVARRRGTSRRKRTAIELGFVPARPFMRPALLAAQDAMANAFAAGVDSGITQAVKRLAKNPASRG